MWPESPSYQSLRGCWASPLSQSQWCFAEHLLADRSAVAGPSSGQAFPLGHRLWLRLHILQPLLHLSRHVLPGAATQISLGNNWPYDSKPRQTEAPGREGGREPWLRTVIQQPLRAEGSLPLLYLLRKKYKFLRWRRWDFSSWDAIPLLREFTVMCNLLLGVLALCSRR